MRADTYTISELETIANKAIAELRLSKFEQGLPFMIGDIGLPSGQFYYEFQDGRIAIVAFAESEKDYQVFRYLDDDEALVLRTEYGLSPTPTFHNSWT